MDMAILKEVLLWCTAINFGVLLLWFAMLILAHDWVFRLHTRFFTFSRQTFDTIHYAAMAGYKLSILLFNLVPLIALHAVT